MSANTETTGGPPISLDAMPVPLANGRGFAWVSPGDWEAVKACKWKARVSGRRVYAGSHHSNCGHGGDRELHKVIGDLMGISRSSHVDHADGNGLNCTRQNLRAATRSQNNANSDRRGPGSGFRGITKNWNRFAASISVGHKYRYLGLFPTAEAAARVYDEWAHAAFGEFARLNFPRPQLAADWVEDCLPESGR